MIWFSADLHLGHENIIKYCNRPFKTLDDMNNKIIQNWNSRVKNTDIVYHIGDFCFKGGLQGSITGSKYWEKQLNGKIIHFSGNHDKNNSLKNVLKSGKMHYGGKNLHLQHIPPKEKDYGSNVDIILCGHVHEKWKSKIEFGIPVVNVGVDVWNFYPINIQEIMKYIVQKTKKQELV